jgi:hypothetical protein
MSDIESELQVRVRGFVDELSALIRRQALEAVEEVLEKGESGGVAAPAHRLSAGSAPRGRGRPRKAAVESAAPRARAGRGGPKPVASPKRKAGEKRTPQQLAQITEQLYNFIKSNGGQGVEQIAKALATPTKELTLPIRKLIRDKKISSKGQKRATRYFPR